MTLVTKNVDLLSYDLVDKIHDLVYQQVLHIKDKVSDDTSAAYDNLQILSSMIEFIQYD
jgi:hypothetical protein